MPRITVGWVGNYRRTSKNFDVAQHATQKFGWIFKVAGPPHSKLYIPFGDMPSFYRSIDLLLVTSNAEAHPLAVYEALSCGTPVVMMKVGDCYAEEVSGICYYGYLDADSIHEAVSHVLRNRSDMGRDGRKSIVKRWTWNHWIPTYTNMFRAVTGKSRGFRIVIPIDKPGWAWDIMAEILTREFLKTGLYEYVHTAYSKPPDSESLNIKNIVTDDYDAILNHCWQLYNHRTIRNFHHSKNILCANGEAYRKEGKTVFNEMAPIAGGLTSVSKLIVRDLRKKFKRPTFHCSRGVYTQIFRP